MFSVRMIYDKVLSDQDLKVNTQGQVGEFDKKVVYQLRIASPRGEFKIQSDQIEVVNKGKMNLEINLKDAIPSFKVNDVHIVDLSDAANAETKEKVMNIIGT